MSQQTCKLLGVETTARMTMEQWLQCFDTSSQQDVIDAWQEAKVHGIPLNFEVALDKSGASASRWMRMMGTCQWRESEWIGFHGTMQEGEVELRKRREESFRQARFIQLGELAAGIGHEINNPLAIATCSIDKLQRLQGASSIKKNDVA